MKDKDLNFNREWHNLYSKACKKEIKKKIALHYTKEDRDDVWNKIQKKYVAYLNEWNINLGGKRNFHNGKGGTYDCIAIMTYFYICKDFTNLKEIEEIEENLILPSFKKLKFVNCNKKIWKKLMYKAFLKAKSMCDKWNDYKMIVSKFENDKPIYYEFRSCPVAEFAKKFNLTEVMPALCNVDYKSMELIHAKLIRKCTVVDSDKCDYTICGDKDEFVKKHPEYRDELGFRRNK